MPTLTSNEIALLVIVGCTLALIVSNRVRPDLVALLVLLSLGLSGIIRPDQALAGFSQPAVITIVGLFAITAALERTGVVQWLAGRLARLGGGGEARMTAVFMLAGALLSLAMNNIAAGAVLLPAAVSVARRAQVRPARLLIPLAFGTLLGGMATLFTTANIVISGSLQAQGQRALTMLDFLPIGGLTALAGAGYMLTVGRRLLPDRESVVRSTMPIADLSQTYQLAERLWEVRVQPDSPLVRQPLSNSVIGAQLGATVLAIWHGREARIPPAPNDMIAANDILLVLGREDRVRQLASQGTTIGRTVQPHDRRLGLPVHLTEVLIAPRSPAIGQTLKDLRFRSKFGLTTVALWREGRSYRTDVGDFVLQAGDALLMVGPNSAVRTLSDEPGYIVLDQGYTAHAPDPVRARWAVLITVLVLLLSALGLVPTAEAMLAGAAALVLTRCLTMEDAYRAIEWRVVVLIAGMLPIGTALAATGLAGRIGLLFSNELAGAGPLALIAGLYLFTVALTQFVGGQVAALTVGPLAVSAAVNLRIDPAAAGVAVAMACSVAFLSPFAHPVNVLMMGPGGYKFSDFARVGLGLTLLCFVMLLVGLRLIWGVPL
ncbi:MAG TPA: SLC13 family permease [Kouleothrix sp.]|uniref:SLC13 family permease n=1 Tax=Kouleothrix sp. TaxID=2779161 RepID=UPI002D10EC89|nr:SLC13 family permease [Kouleothrix sp.]HRC74071.1 SLC13 family permease [Kouleothrix sp.]